VACREEEHVFAWFFVLIGLGFCGKTP
jgi:hypothetical protein